MSLSFCLSLPLSRSPPNTYTQFGFLFINWMWVVCLVNNCSPKTWFSVVVLLPIYFLYWKYLVETLFRNWLDAFPSTMPFFHRGHRKNYTGLPQNVDFIAPVTLTTLCLVIFLCTCLILHLTFIKHFLWRGTMVKPHDAMAMVRR